VVGSYRVAEQIGRGGMAVVYRALDLRLGRAVALKVLTPELGRDDAFRQRFIRESRAAAGVDHPHIVPVFEAGESDGVLFIAMRYVSGGDVRSLIETGGPLSPGRTAAITGQVAAALDAAHSRGLVHRDVKPGNILLGQASDGQDHVYLSDFGLSKHALASTTLTSTGQFLGTLDYISPEQIQGQPVDGRADQYGLACAVTEMLTGEPPFVRDDTRALMWAQLEAAPPALTQRRPGLPPLVDRVIARALAKTAAGRFPTCRDFAAALAAACAPQSVQAEAPDSTIPPAASAASVKGAPARDPWPSLAGSADSWPTATGPRSDGPELPNGRGNGPARGTHDSARVGGWPDPEPQLAQNFLTAGRPAGTGWPGPQRGTDGAACGTRPLRPARLRPTGRRPVGRSPGRSALAVAAAILAAVFVLGVAGAVAYRLAHRHDAAAPPSPPAAAQSQSPAPGSSARAADSPAARVVEAYIAAINRHDYPRAWQLADRKRPGTLASFTAGFAETSRDVLNIISTQGNLVTAQLTAYQTDGTVRTFEGTYTVTGGKITSSNMLRTS
jgi:serine/threonine-protein kinase